MGNVDVIWTRQVVVARRPQETEALIEDFQDPLSEDQSAAFGLVLENCEDELLLAHRRIIRDLQVSSDLLQIHDIHALELDDVHFLSPIRGSHSSPCPARWLIASARRTLFLSAGAAGTSVFQVRCSELQLAPIEPRRKQLPIQQSVCF